MSDSVSTEPLGIAKYVLLYASKNRQLLPSRMSAIVTLRVSTLCAIVNSPCAESTLMHSSALLNGGYSVSRSHAAAGSIKTDAPVSFVHDVMREWIKEHPVRKDKISEGSPALKLLNKPQQ